MCFVVVSCWNGLRCCHYVYVGMKGFCWCVCIVLLVRSCISSVVLCISSLRFGVSIVISIN